MSFKKAATLTGYQKYKANVIVNRFVNLLSIDILVKSSSFILIPVYLKLFSQNEFGLYNYLLSVSVFLSQILNFGLYVSQSKIYHELETAERGRFLFSLQVLLFSLIALVLLILYLLNIDKYLIHLLFKSSFDYSAYRFPLLLSIIASIYSFMLYNYFLTSEKIKLVQRYNILRLVVVNALVITFLYLFNTSKVNTRLVVTFSVELLLVLSFSLHYVREMVLELNFKLMLRSAKIGFPVMASAICSVVIGFGDKFFLEKKAGFSDLSVYYLAFSVANVIPLIFNTLQNIWMPIFLKEKNLFENLRKTKKIIVGVFGLFILLSIAILVFIKIALYANIIDIKYSRVLYVLPIILLSLSIENTSHLLINYVTYFEQTYVLPVVSVVLGTLSIIININLIGRFGLYGAAYANLCIGILSFFGYLMFLRFNIARFKKNAIVQSQVE